MIGYVLSVKEFQNAKLHLDENSYPGYFVSEISTEIFLKPSTRRVKHESRIRQLIDLPNFTWVKLKQGSRQIYTFNWKLEDF